MKELSRLIKAEGSAIDPARADRRLSPERELRAREARLRQLPERHFVHADLIEHTLEVLRTPDIPLEEFSREARKLPPQFREAFRRGRYGRPRGEGVTSTLDLPSPPAADLAGEGLPARKKSKKNKTIEWDLS